MLNWSLHFLPKSADNLEQNMNESECHLWHAYRSIIIEAKPDPVPPPNEWKIKNPWSELQCSTVRRIRSMQD
jgi:hypothetical protein